MSLSRTGDDPATRRALSTVRMHGAANLAFSSLYAFIGFGLAPSRQLGFSLALLAVVLLLSVSGVALLLGLRVARGIAIAAQATLLLFAATCVVLLVASAAYLRGIYGSLGTGMAGLTLVVVALVVELCGLLPVLQLRALMSPEVRALFAATASPSPNREEGRGAGGGG